MMALWERTVDPIIKGQSLHSCLGHTGGCGVPRGHHVCECILVRCRFHDDDITRDRITSEEQTGVSGISNKIR